MWNEIAMKVTRWIEGAWEKCKWKWWENEC